MGRLISASIRPLGRLALRRFGRSGRRASSSVGFFIFLAMCFLAMCFFGAFFIESCGRRRCVGGRGSAGGRSRVGLSDRGERRENDRGADPDGGQCLHHFTFSVLFNSWPLAGEAMRPSR